MCYEQVILSIMIIPMIIAVAMLILGPPDPPRRGSGNRRNRW